LVEGRGEHDEAPEHEERVERERPRELALLLVLVRPEAEDAPGGPADEGDREVRDEEERGVAAVVELARDAEEHLEREEREHGLEELGRAEREPVAQPGRDRVRRRGGRLARAVAQGSDAPRTALTSFRAAA